jgi:hypothetical protein
MTHPPCELCPSMVICRMKILNSDGSNLWNKLWTFMYLDKTAECDILFDYIDKLTIKKQSQWTDDISVKQSTNILISMQLLKEDYQ